MEVEASEIKKAVERLHGCSASIREIAQVKEEFHGQIVWEGIVYVFGLTGHPQANICYAWSSPIEGSEKRKFYAVLNIPPVDSPLKAVQASIVQDHRNK